MKYLAFAAAMLATPAMAIQCPDGSWHDLLEHCDMPPSFQCWDGSWRNDLQWCPAEVSDDRPEPRLAVGEGE